MPDVAIPIVAPNTPNCIGIFSITIQTANGTSTVASIGGPVLPAGTVSATIVPAEWSGDVFIRALPAIRIPDVVAWLGAIDPPEMAAESATRFDRVMKDLLWLLRLELSKTGVAPPPTVGG